MAGTSPAATGERWQAVNPISIRSEARGAACRRILGLHKTGHRCADERDELPPSCMTRKKHSEGRGAQAVIDNSKPVHSAA